MSLEQRCAALREWAKRRAAKASKLMYQRIQEVEARWLQEAEDAIGEIKDTLGALCTGEPSQEQCNKVFDLVLSSRKLDTSEQALLDTTKEKSRDTGSVAPEANGDTGVAPGSDRREGEGNSGVPARQDQQGQHGLAARASSKRNRATAGG